MSTYTNAHKNSLVVITDLIKSKEYDQAEAIAANARRLNIFADSEIENLHNLIEKAKKQDIERERAKHA